MDEELFFARRLGYGLKHGETIGSSVRDWAVKQISFVPPLDFYGPNGTNVRMRLPDYAEPTTSFYDACKLWGETYNLEAELFAKTDKMDAADWHNQMRDGVWLPRSDYPYWRDCLVRSLTAVHGPSPVFERFWSFWVNHFTVSARPFTKPFYGPHTRAIRDLMTGSFSEMLRDAVLNPAMLHYLDNHLSTGPNSEIAKHTSETINENLAREVLELHTISPDGGYTQDDVIELAYALSGWSYFGGAVDQPEIRGNPYGTYFEVKRHEPGKRTIMGKTYSDRNRGMNQAPLFFEDLAKMPQTAQFLAFKLARHFIADVPPEESVAAIRDVFLETGGDLVAVHIAVIDQVIAIGMDHTKFSTPETWLYQAHRTSGAQISLNLPWSYEHWINVLCEELGQSYNECPQPNGWSDLEADWTSVELLERRVRYAYMLGQRIYGDENQGFLRETAVRLAGDGSELVSAIDGTERTADIATILFASPQFMRI